MVCARTVPCTALVNVKAECLFSCFSATKKPLLHADYMMLDATTLDLPSTIQPDKNHQHLLKDTPPGLLKYKLNPNAQGSCFFSRSTSTRVIATCGPMRSRKVLNPL